MCVTDHPLPGLWVHYTLSVLEKKNVLVVHLGQLVVGAVLLEP